MCVNLIIACIQENNDESATIVDGQTAESIVIHDTDSKEIRSTKRPTTSNRSKKTSKRQKEDEDYLLQRAINCMEQSGKASNSTLTRDPDDIFGEYVANELKSITDCSIKWRVKFNIQSVLFHSFGQQAPQMMNSLPAMHPQMTSPSNWQDL